MKRFVLAVTMLIALLALFAFAGVACSPEEHVQVESNTCWLTSFDRSVDARFANCGNSSYRVDGTIHCVFVTNVTDTGFVRVRINGGPWSESSTPRGQAVACIR